MDDRDEAAGGASLRAVVGLGNPGERYRETRHNLGFRVVQEVARRLGVPIDRQECNSLVGVAAVEDDLLLVLPQTYMNRSGYAVRCLRERHDLDPDRLLVVYDDVQLPLGRLRLRPGGSPGGHKGMESMVENLRTDRIPRLRLGCFGEAGPPAGEELVEYVLAPFEADEQEAVEEMITRAADACATWLDEGIEAAMNRHNG